MNAPYQNERDRQGRNSVIFGIVLTVTLNGGVAAFGAFNGMKYIYPPPEEKSILIDFSESERLKPKQIRTGTQPRAAQAEPEKKLELVQKSEAQHEGTKANEAPEASPGDKGDVEVPEPPKKKEIDKRALFRTADNTTKKDTLAPQTADKASDRLKAGHALGNTRAGKTDGKPNARLTGRSVVGSLPNPNYSVQNSGIVVVEIWVDRYGTVTNAVPGGQGTTVTDKTLWNEARKAALEAHFNMDANAPEKQKGTITYIFNLR